MLFSERFGHKPAKVHIQLDDIDEDLRNSLWNVLSIFYWEEMKDYQLSDDPDFNLFCKKIWMYYFKKPLDQMDDIWRYTLNELKEYFFNTYWHEVYSFMEFIAQNSDDICDKNNFLDFCNKILEKEMSGYRFVDDKITPITDNNEINEIETALSSSQNPVQKHLTRSLELLSDKNKPDYRNSIKESISAVESLVSLQLGKSGTLGQLLKKLESDIVLHPALNKAFSNLYGYTSDESGIRHALIEEDSVDFQDAKFMLVTCSAFINYVQGKAANK